MALMTVRAHAHRLPTRRSHSHVFSPVPRQFSSAIASWAASRPFLSDAGVPLFLGEKLVTEKLNVWLSDELDNGEKMFDFAVPIEQKQVKARLA